MGGAGSGAGGSGSAACGVTDDLTVLSLTPRQDVAPVCADVTAELLQDACTTVPSVSDPCQVGFSCTPVVGTDSVILGGYISAEDGLGRGSLVGDVSGVRCQYVLEVSWTH